MKLVITIVSLFFIQSFSGCEKTEVDLKEQFLDDWYNYMKYEGYCDQLTFYTFNANDTIYHTTLYVDGHEPFIHKIPYVIISENELEAKWYTQGEYTRHEYIIHSDNILEIKAFVPTIVMEIEDLVLIRKSACKEFREYKR